MEKYGTVPPRFTKAWWEHYWYYYKYHVLAIAATGFIVGSVIHSCVTTPDYDLQIEYLSEFLPSDESISIINEKICEFSEDATGNGKTEAQMLTVTSMGDGLQDAQYTSAIYMKILAELSIGEMQVYIMDENFVKYLEQHECFIPVSEWATNVNQDDLYNDSIISISGNKILEEAGIKTEGHYMGVMGIIEKNKEDEVFLKKHENAKNVARQLIGE